MKLSCDVTRDLLPLYHDGVCSDESSSLVEDHLKTCPECDALMTQLRGEIELPHEEPDDRATLEKIGQRVRNGKKRAWLRGAAAVLAVAVLVFAGVNIWWYTQVYQFYAQFAEGKPQVMHNTYDRNTGELISSEPSDPLEYQWHTENMEYFHVVHLPNYLQDNGEAALHIMHLWNVEGQEGKTVHTSVYMGREQDMYSVYLTIYQESVNPRNGQVERTSTQEYVRLDKDLNLIYGENWSEEIRLRKEKLMEEYHEQIMGAVEAAQAEWPFLTQ